MVPESTTELDSANQKIEGLTAQTQSLTADLAGVHADNATMTSSLEDAQVEVDATKAQNDTRKTRLDQREKALDQREQELDQRESVVADSSAADSTGGIAVDNSAFDREYAMSVTGDIVQEVKTVDHRLKDGIAVSSALYLLANDFERLQDAGTPPGVTAADYHARLTTLGSFASQASDIYDANPMEGSAKYAVLREQTGPLLGTLNSALGTSFSLP